MENDEELSQDLLPPITPEREDYSLPATRLGSFNGAPNGSPQAASYHVDSLRDIDLSPILLFFCGCLPCCCCLYSPIDDDDESYYGNIRQGSVNSVGSPAFRRSMSAGGGFSRGNIASDGGMNSNVRKMRTNAFPVNKNALLLFIVAFLHGIADSLWRGTILSLFIVQLGANHGESDGAKLDLSGYEWLEYVGYLEGMYLLGSIFVTLIFRLPGLRDWYKHETPTGSQNIIAHDNTVPPITKSRSFVIKCGAALLFLTAIFNIILLTALLPGSENTSDKLFYHLSLPTLLFWGMASTLILNSPPSKSLFTSSIPFIDQARYGVILYLISTAASTIGPLVSIVLFGILGNNYSVSTFRVIWIVGIALEMLVGLLSFGFSEEYVLAEDFTYPDPHLIDDLRTESSVATEEGVLRSGQDTSERSEPLLSRSKDSSSFLPSVSSCSKPPRSLVPTVLFLSTFIISIGNGFFIKYYPLFFKDVAQMPPVEIQSLYVVLPLLMMVFTDFHKRLSASKCLGRLMVVMLVKLLGILGVFLMGTSSRWDSANSGSESQAYPHTHTVALSLLFLIRTIFMNSTHTVEGNIFMEFTKPSSSRLGIDSRTMWKQWEVLHTIARALSASFGGVVINWYRNIPADERHSDPFVGSFLYDSNDEPNRPFLDLLDNQNLQYDLSYDQVLGIHAQTAQSKLQEYNEELENLQDGYSFALRLTAYVQLVGVLLLLVILPIVPRQAPSTENRR